MSIRLLTQGIFAQHGVVANELDSDAQVLIAAMTTKPNSMRQTLISDTIKSLKAAGIWVALDELWMMAAHDPQAGLLGWKRYRDLTAVNAPSFTTDRGYAGNGTTSYLNTGFVPSADGVNFTLNDASFGARTLTLGTASNTRFVMGARNGGTVAQATLHYPSTNAYAEARVNFGSSNGARGSYATGLLVARRVSSGTVELWQDGEVTASAGAVSTSASVYSMYLGGLNDGGTLAFACTNQLAFAFVGAGLTTEQQEQLHSIEQAYLVAVGAIEEPNPIDNLMTTWWIAPKSQYIGT